MIVYSIIATALLACAAVGLGYEHSLRLKAQEQLAETENELDTALERISGYRIEKANRDGVDAGRTADDLYRRFLEQFDAHEQVTVILQRDDARYYAKH